MSLSPGARVGPYEIVGPLGAGGMGEVYRAHDDRLGRDVALKILPGTTARDPAALERFTREARAVAALNHPHIVTIHSTEEADGIRFITMELIEGRTLDRVIPAGGVSLAQFFAIATAMADALAAAHQKEILHRDLKPGNVMLTDSGRVKVLDFGLARAPATVASAATDDATRAWLTGEGTILGTAAYMSPEQIEGKPLDGRSDLFALGAVMYELLIGERPFRGDSSPAVMAAVMKDRPRTVAERRPDVATGVSRLVDRCLEKSPHDRPQSAQDVLAELKGLKSGWESGTLATGSKAVVARRSKRMLVIGLGAAALVSIAIAAFVLLRGRTSGEVSVTMTSITNSGQVSVAAISPDGRYLAYVEARDGKYAVFVQQVATGSAVEVMPPGDNDYFGLTFSPDSNYVYAAERVAMRLRRVPSLGGPVTTAMEQVRSAITFSPDGGRIAFSTFDPVSTSIVVASADGTNRRPLLVHRAGEGPIGRSVSWSPDGKTIAATTRAAILLLDAASGAPTSFAVAGWETLESVNWTPAGDALIVTAEPVGEASARHQVLEVSYPGGRVRRLTNDLNDYHTATISADGRIIAAVPLTVRAKIWSTTLSAIDAAQPMPRGGLNDGAQGLAWTADGRVAFADQNSVAWIVNADGSNRQPLTAEHGRARGLSPCGPTLLTYWLPHGTGVSLFVIDPVGGQSQHVADGPAGLGPFPVCTPDGKWLVFTGGRNLMKVPVAGGTPSLVAEQTHEGRVSPDGTLIAAHHMIAGQNSEEFAIFSVANGTLVRALPGDITGDFTWLADGSALVGIAAGADSRDNFVRIPVDGSPRTAISHLTPTDRIFFLSLHPDGRLVFSRGTA